MSFAVVAPIVGAIATIAATGFAVYSSQQQAASQRSIANQNFQLQQDAAERARKQNLRALELQTAQLGLQQTQRSIEAQTVDLQDILLDKKSRVMEETFEIQQEQLAKRKEALEKNKDTAFVNAEMVAREGLERTRRIKDQEEETISRQRAIYAAAGVLVEGTPLAVLGDTAATYSLIAQDELYQSDLERRQHLLTADAIGMDIEGIGLEGELLDLQLELGMDNIELEKQGLNIARTGSGISNQQLELQKGLLQLDSYSAQSQFRNRVRQAGVDRYAGNQAAYGTELTGYGNLIQGIGSATNSLSQIDFKKPANLPNWKYNASSTLIS